MGAISTLRGLLPVLLVIAVSGLVACKPSVDSAIAVPEAGLADISWDRDLVDSLQGVWATDERIGDDAETVIMLSPDEDHGLQLVHDGTWWPAIVEDSDRDNSTVALVTRHPYNPQETLTFRKIYAGPADRGGSFSLQLTYGNGRTAQLGFVRRLTARDQADIARIIGDGPRNDTHAADPLQAHACDTGTLPNLRATLVCNEQGFARQEADIRLQFTQLRSLYPDSASTVASAEKQLDSCASRRCLTEAYASWKAYFDDNYGLADLDAW